MLLGYPEDEQRLLVLSAAQRLDTAHLQIERVREGIETVPTEAPEGSIAFGERAAQILGDVEMAMVALDKALDILCSLSGRYGVEVGS